MCLAQGLTPPLTMPPAHDFPRDQPSGDAAATALSSTGLFMHLPGFTQEGPSTKPTDPFSCFLPATLCRIGHHSGPRCPHCLASD